MANGERTAGAVQGATLGAAAGPVGAAAGAGIGYGLAALGGLFGKKKKKTPAVAKAPKESFLQKYGLVIGLGSVGVVIAGGVVLILVVNRK